MEHFRALGHQFYISALSLIGGAVFYAIWLAVFLLISQFDIGWVETLLWVLAPFVTALGFASSAWVYLRYKGIQTSFLSVYLWPLGGCIIGVVLVYWYGPMLIIFSMLTLGSAGIFLRELKRPVKTSTMYPAQQEKCDANTETTL